MQHTTRLFCLFLLLSSLSAQENPSPFLEELLQDYPSVRDLALGLDEAYFTVQSPLGEVSVIMVSVTFETNGENQKLPPFPVSIQIWSPFSQPMGGVFILHPADLSLQTA